MAVFATAFAPSRSIRVLCLTSHPPRKLVRMSDPQQPPHTSQPGYQQPGHQQQAGQQQPDYQQQPGQPVGYPATFVPSQSGYPSPAYNSASAQGPGNALSRTAFFLAIAAAVLGWIFMLATPLLVSTASYGYGLYQVLSTTFSILTLILGTLAFVLGLIAARRGAQPVLAGIAIGVGAVEVLGTLLSFIVSFIYAVL